MILLEVTLLLELLASALQQGWTPAALPAPARL